MKASFIITGFLIASFALQAQTDSTTNKKANKTKGVPLEQKSQPTKNMVKVDPNTISKGLAKTLSESAYQGWEKGTLYFDTKTKEYALLLPTLTPEEANMKYNRDISAKKTPEHTGWYFFTQEGTPISN